MGLEQSEVDSNAHPTACVSSSDTTQRLAYSRHFSGDVTLDLSSPPTHSPGAPRPRPMVFINPCVASNPRLRGGVSQYFHPSWTLECLLWTPLAPVSHSLWVFSLLLPVSELDKLKKLSHEIRNPGKYSNPPTLHSSNPGGTPTGMSGAELRSR